MIKAPKLVRRLGVATMAGVTILGGLVTFAASAGADVSTTSVALVGTAPSMAQGVVGAAAAGWTFTLPSTAAVGDELQFIVNPDGLTSSTVNCSNLNYVSFAATPTVVLSGNAGLGGTGPVLSVSAPTTEPGTQNACATEGIKNEITLTVTTAEKEGLLGLGATPYTVSVSGVAYSIGYNAALGAVSTADSDYVNGNAAPPTAKPLTVPTNATVIKGVTVGANDPAVALTYGNDTNMPISPIGVIEAAAGQVPTGYVCVTIEEGSFDLSTEKPTISAVPVVTSGTTGIGTVGAAVTNPIADTLAFDVTTASTTTPTGYALGDLQVDGGTLLGPVGLTVVDGATATCTGGHPVDTEGVRAFSVLYPFRTYGQDADGTAAAEMESTFPPPSKCPASHAVVLATDQNFPDALSASYLAGVLDTGILLTPTAALSTETADALAAEGITHVYVVGGVLAVSQNVINQLEAQPAYTCGATAALTPTQPLVVTVISGQTQYDTSQDIATYFSTTSGDVGQLKFPGAYGRYDNTTGAESSTGLTTAAPTAIMATGVNFEDASAASVLGYADKLPVILTSPTTLSTQAQTALTQLAIKQVILVGGPLAVSDTVLEQIEDLGISVLRVAGQDYTDTAQELARFELSSLSSSAGAEGLDWDANSDHIITLARGDFYSDSLAGAAFAAQIDGAGHPMPILLTFDPNTVGTYLTNFLDAAGSDAGVIGDGTASEVDGVFIVGGPLAITDATVANVLTDLAGG